MAEQPDTVDAYIASFPAEVQPVLTGIRQSILAGAPGATESISYGMPTVSRGGHLVVYFAGWKRHVALYSIPGLDPELEAEVAPYRAAKDTVQFSLAKPVPYDLIERVTAVLVGLRAG